MTAGPDNSKLFQFRDKNSVNNIGIDFEDDGSTEDDIEYNEFDDSDQEEWWKEDESRDDSEEMDCEQDIEEHEYAASGDPARTLKIRLFLTDKQVGGSKWMKNFVAKCTCDGVAVATAHENRTSSRRELATIMHVDAENRITKQPNTRAHWGSSDR
ncbi:hypothetical protein PENSUB_3381 [Penicillium subrubescens]|uniref:Uncharacterized protein n=1 Tax=Penicillium subrubescens TaxID=1316194 RepID=A0A1Q5UR84_9EURO|nr:hypothetical protein PENSUB_3381 [Penicillium subrubescens]